MNWNTDTLAEMRKKLLDWYRRNQRRLPWRQTRDPYAIWVSEVMLQQTQVAGVIPYYRRFMDRFPTVADLAGAHAQEVLKLWEGLGYYARARNLHRAAGMVVAEFDGQVPSDRKAFKSLPGVGDYIAAAVLSIAFGQALAVVDGNVKRVLGRLCIMEAPVNHAVSHKVFQSAADQLLDRSCPARFNQAVMELGALVCTPKNPRCTDCPLVKWCRAKETDTVGIYPRRNRTKPVPTHHIAVGVIKKDDRVLITKRADNGLLGGLWEFPGGKVKKGESPENACAREIHEETGLEVNIASHLTRVRHAYTHFKIEMDVYWCQYFSGRVTLDGPVDYRWITLEEIRHYPFPGPISSSFPC